MSFDEDNELGVFCTDCGDETFLNPNTGRCLDCDLEAGSDEEEGDEDLEICVSCGDAVDDLDEDDVCGSCKDD